METIEKTAVIRSMEIACAKAELREDGIVCFRMKEDYLIDVPDLKAVTDAIGELGAGKKFPILTIAHSMTNLTAEAIDDSINPHNFKYTLADAFVIKSFNQRLIANFYIKVIKPPVPTKYFDNEEDAVEWLRSL